MNRRQFIALAQINGLGPRTLDLLIKQFGTPSLCLSSSSQTLKALGLSSDLIHAIKHPDWQAVERTLSWSEQVNHHLLTWCDKDYPPALRVISSPPPMLYLIGDKSLLNLPQIAIVGTRRPSQTGIKQANLFARGLSQLGLCITSGLAKGIDIIAHQSTLKAKGKTIAVLGTGIDRLYPSQHKAIAKQLTESGLLISEFPLGTPAKPQHFPQRNRIISGLSLGVLVVEAAIKSGSLITARLAIEEGREVFAIPGTISNPMTKGCHHLIKQGAKLTETVKDILIEIAPQLPSAPPYADHNDPIDIPSDLQTILDHIGYHPTSIDEISRQTGLTYPLLTEKLTTLELKDLISATPGGYLKI